MHTLLARSFGSALLLSLIVSAPSRAQPALPIAVVTCVTRAAGILSHPPVAVDSGSSRESWRHWLELYVKQPVVAARFRSTHPDVLAFQAKLEGDCSSLLAMGEVPVQQDAPVMDSCRARSEAALSHSSDDATAGDWLLWRGLDRKRIALEASYGPGQPEVAGLHSQIESLCLNFLSRK